MSDKMELIPGNEELEKELNRGIETLKGLVERKADETMLTFQKKIVRMTLEDLITAICGEEEETLKSE